MKCQRRSIFTILGTVNGTFQTLCLITESAFSRGRQKLEGGVGKQVVSAHHDQPLTAPAPFLRKFSKVSV